MRTWRQPGAACALHNSSWLGVVKAVVCVRRASSAGLLSRLRSGAGVVKAAARASSSSSSISMMSSRQP